MTKAVPDDVLSGPGLIRAQAVAISTGSDNNTTSPAVRWGLGAVLLALPGVALLVSDGGWLAITGGWCCHSRRKGNPRHA